MSVGGLLLILFGAILKWGVAPDALDPAINLGFIGVALMALGGVLVVVSLAGRG